MPICQISLTDFRNLQSTTLDFNPSLNLITGDNGSGKTSLLEAIYVLCQACSFRTHHLKKAIAHSSDNFLTFGRFSDYKAGLSKSDQKLEIRVDGETIKKRSLLVHKTPINIVNADSFELIIGSPQNRRSYLDWCLFHVEPCFNEFWLKFRHALRQRNRLLKSRKDLDLLDYWEDYLVEPSLILQKYRRQYCEEIAVLLNTEMADLIDDMSFSIEYQQGWKNSLSLKEALQKDRERDARSGFTHSGIHRDNLQILADGYPAAEVLSRGQLKRLSLALLVAALKTVKNRSDRPMILLIDDLRAEMDDSALDKYIQAFCRWTYSSLLPTSKTMFLRGYREKILKCFTWNMVLLNLGKSVSKFNVRLRF